MALEIGHLKLGQRHPSRNRCSCSPNSLSSRAEASLPAIRCTRSDRATLFRVVVAAGGALVDARMAVTHAYTTGDRAVAEK